MSGKHLPTPVLADCEGGGTARHDDRSNVITGVRKEGLRLADNRPRFRAG